ncbi:MAG: response regulator [Sedimenticolaceae bacterium]
MIDPANLPGKRILLVDDSKSARFVLRTLLQKRGLTVDMADSAEVALEMIQNAPPDAVFMDHLMPGMDGHAATVALKANPATAHIPIVMCTSNDRPEHVEKAKELGALGILPKPATPEKLSEILAALDRESATSTQPAVHPTPISPAPSIARSQELQTTLRAMLPPLIEETLTPLIERIVTERWQTTRSQDLAADATQIETAIAQRLEAGKLDWLREVTDGVERQIVAESVSAERRLEKTLAGRLAAAARENQIELKQHILTDDELRASFSATVTSSVEQLAAAIAKEQADDVAQNTVKAIVPPLVAASVAKTEQQLAAIRRRTGWLGAATILVGLVGVAALFLSATT